ncbi:hypothetical protein EGW08_019361, partial [Elysia chlorotica]
SEYISPGKSSLELLVDFFIDLTQDLPTDRRNSLWHIWNPATELVVGLNKQYLTKKEDVKEDVLDLIFNILRHGGDVTVQDEHRRTPLHHAARLCPDMSLMCLLHTNGGSLVQVDTTGNCPLLSVCSVDKIGEDEEDVWDVSSASSTESGSGFGGSARSLEEEEEFWQKKLRIARDPLMYLIKAKETDIDRQNNLGQTALFYTILREDMRSARLLLEAGACPSLQACVWKSRRKKRTFSALFGSLMSIPLQRSLQHSSLYDRMVKPVQPISVLVDAGYFTTEEVVTELANVITSDFPEFSHLRPMADSLLHLMFGYKSASLKQLAARRVFQCCLLENLTCLHTILPVSAILESYPTSSVSNTSQDTSSPSTSPRALSLPQLLASNPGKLEEYLTLVLNCTVLKRLTHLLQLPSSLQLNLEAQLLFLRMLLKFSSLSVWRPPAPSIFPIGGAISIGMQGGIGRFVPGGGIFRIGDHSDGSGDDEDDNDSSDDSGSSYNSSSAENLEGDSDLEYW